MENLLFLFKIASNFVGEYKIIIKYLAEAIKFVKFHSYLRFLGIHAI